MRYNIKKKKIDCKRDDEDQRKASTDQGAARLAQKNAELIDRVAANVETAKHYPRHPTNSDRPARYRDTGNADLSGQPSEWFRRNRRSDPADARRRTGN